MQIAGKLDIRVEQVKNVIIWGNHSSTQYPDVNQGTVDMPDGRVSIREAVKNDDWLNGDFIKVLILFDGEIIDVCVHNLNIFLK